MELSVRTPASNLRGPQYMEQALAAIHQADPHRLPFTLTLGQLGGSVALSVRVPDELRTVVESQLYAQYPDCKIEDLGEELPATAAGYRTWTADLTLDPWLLPIKRYVQYDDPNNKTTADPLTSLLTALERSRRDPVSACVEITLAPASRRLKSRGHRALRTYARPFFRSHPRLAHWYLTLALSPRRSRRLLGRLLGRLGREESSHPSAALHTSNTRHDREEDLQAAATKLGHLLFEANVRVTVSGPKEAAAQAKRKLKQIAGTFGVFHSPGLSSFAVASVRRSSGPPRRYHSAPFLLSTEEAASLWHPPGLSVRTPSLAVVESRELPPPMNLPVAREHADLAVLGTTAFRSQRETFGIRLDDRRRHVVIEGKTGMGKSTLLAHLLTSDIHRGRGVGLVDPHGDLCSAVLRSVPKARTNDVILFDAGDRHFPLAFNLLDCPRAELRPLVASGILSTFKKLFGDSWGPRLEHILRNSLLALLETKGTSLISLLRLLSDSRFRRALVEQLADPVVKAFWEQEFDRMPVKLQAEAIAPVQNKVGAFVSSPILRNIVGQAESRLDLRKAMDEDRIVLANVSKGQIGDDASALLGSFLVTAIQLAAMSRADTPEEQRKDFFLYVDEFQNYSTESFAAILSEARKYRLCLTVANQYLGQMDEATRDAVFGNVGTFIAFQVGAQDAELVQQQLAGEVTEPDLLALPKHYAYVRLSIDGSPSRPFSMETLPPPGRRKDEGRPAIIRRTSRQRYSRPAAQAERQVRELLSV